jgi:hypothetical protein
VTEWVLGSSGDPTPEGGWGGRSGEAHRMGREPNRSAILWGAKGFVCMETRLIHGPYVQATRIRTAPASPRGNSSAGHPEALMLHRERQQGWHFRGEVVTRPHVSQFFVKSHRFQPGVVTNNRRMCVTTKSCSSQPGREPRRCD